MADPSLHQSQESAPLTELIQAEQRDCWQHGDRVRVEVYFDRYPAILHDAESAVDLIYGEFVLREELGEAPDTEEYLQRFPRFAKELSEQFEFRAALKGLPEQTAATPDTTPQFESTVEASTPAAAGTRTSSPSRVARFEIREKLGSGGFGCMYRAYDPQLGRDVALKVPHPHLLTDEYRERFLREARAAGQLQHPNLVAVHDSGVTPDGSYIAYQFISGCTLAEHLKQRSFSSVEAAGLISKLAQAGHYAHTKGVFHRDLKAANVLIDEQGEPHISDFGLARVEGDSTLTADAAVLGTPAYMSPEQAAGASHTADARSDVYTLGVVLYELLTGHLPFTGSPHSVLRQVIEQEPVPLHSLNKNIPIDLETICLKAMAKRPADRYPSAQHLADDLERWLHDEPIQARPVGQAERLLRWCRRNPLVAGLAVAATVLLVAVGVVSTVAYFVTSAAYTREAEHRRIAVRQRDIANQHLYFAHMHEGMQAWRDAAIANMVRRLNQYVPQPGQHDLRGWEWYYLNSLLHREWQSLDSQQAGVDALVWSPDRRWLASAGKDLSIKIWDMTTGRTTNTLQGHTDGITTLAWSPDSQRLASGNLDQTVRVWNVGFDGEPLIIRAHTGAVWSVCWSPDAQRFASGSRDGDIKIWDVSTNRAEQLQSWYAGDPHSVAWSPDGHWLVSGGGGPILRIWDATTGIKVRELVGHAEAVNAVVWSPDNRRLASCGVDQVVRIWDVESGEQVHELKGHKEAIYRLSWCAKNNRLASGSGDRMIKVWDTEQGRELYTLRGHTGGTSAAWRPDGSYLATGSTTDETIRIWDLSTVDSPRILAGHQEPVHFVAWRPDGQQLASASSDRTVRLWDAGTGAEIRMIRAHNHPVVSLAWSSDGRRLASTEDSTVEGEDSPGTVKIWDVATGKELHTLTHSRAVRFVSWNPRGECLASVASDRTVSIWDASTGDCLLNLNHENDNAKDTASAVAWCCDGKRLAAAHSSLVTIWDTTTGQHVRTLRGHTGDVYALVWSPDGRRLVSTGLDETILIWDVNSGELAHSLTGHTSRILSLDWTQDGRRLVSSGYDNTIKIWDPEAGQETLSLNDHQSTVHCVAWSPDGKKVASAGYDKAVRIWDASKGYEQTP